MRHLVTRLGAVRRVALLASMALVAAVMSPGSAYANDPRQVRVTLVRATSSLLTYPTVVTNAGDSRLFVGEKRGVIRVVNAGRVQAKPYLDLRSVIGATGGEQGLLGLAFHPDFKRNRYLFVSHNNPDGSIGLTRFQAATAGAPTASYASRVSLLTIAHPGSQVHNGGMIAFGPDGMLYLSTGDGGSSPQRAQDPASLLGKILRLDVNRACAPARYCVPAGNPYASTRGARAEIWHLGLRNPWRFSFDRVAGSMWIGDVGNATWEEVDSVGKGVGGRNFGWPCREGLHAHPGRCRTGPLTDPVAEMPHSDGSCAVTGGYVYRGRQSPALVGLYVYTDICSQRIWGARRVGSGWVRAQLGTSLGSISSFGESSTGELFAVDLNGRLSQLQGRAV